MSQTPATGFLRSLPDTLAGIVDECDAKLAMVEEQRQSLLRDRNHVAELLAVAKLAEFAPESIRLMDGTADLQDAA